MQYEFMTFGNPSFNLDFSDTVILTIIPFSLYIFYILSGGLSSLFQLSKLSLANVYKGSGLVNRYL